MSDVTPVEAIPGLNSPAAKVYVEGKRTPVEVADAYANVSLMLSDERRALALKDDNGDGITIPRERVVSVAERTERVQIQGNPFWGKKITFRGLDAYNQDNPDEAVDGYDASQYVAVIGEDLAEALICVVHPATGHLAWTNPAEPVRSIKRIVKAVRLLAEAQQLEDDANLVQGQTPTSTLRGAGLAESQIDAQHVLEAGLPVSQAVHAGGREFVVSFLSEVVTDQFVEATLDNGVAGQLVRYDADDDQFQVETHLGDVVVVKLERIVKVKLSAE